MSWEFAYKLLCSALGGGLIVWARHHDRLYLKGKRKTFFWAWTGFGRQMSPELWLRRSETFGVTIRLAKKTGSRAEAERLMKRYIRPDKPIEWAYNEAVKYLDQNKNPRHR